MAAQIEVKKLGENIYRIQVSDGAGKSLHEVTVQSSDHRRLTGGKIGPEELLRRSFAFLLEREPKESILARFDLMVIGRYFPEYEREIARGL